MRRRTGRALCALVAALALAPLAPRAAAADTPPSPAERRKARALYDDAEALIHAERWADALAKLEALVSGYKAAETPAVLFYVGLCEANLGRLRDALRDYRRARDMLAADTRSPARERKLLDDQLAAGVAGLEPRLAHVTLRWIPGDPEVRVLRITLDGTEVEPATIVDAPFAVDPGQHRLAAEAPAMKPLAREFAAAEGQEVKLNLGFEPLVAPAPRRRPAAPPPPPPAPRGRTQRAFGYASLSVGAAALLAGGAHVVSDRLLGDDDDNADVISLAALGGGALGVGAGIFLLATAPSRSAPARAAGAAPATAWQFGAAPLPRGGAAFRIGGSF